MSTVWIIAQPVCSNMTRSAASAFDNVDAINVAQNKTTREENTRMFDLLANFILR